MRMPKLQEIFAKSSCYQELLLLPYVTATRYSLFCKMFSPLFCFEQEKTLKNVSKKLYSSKIKKNRRSTDEN